MPMSSLADDIKAGLKSVGGEWKRAKKHDSDKTDRVHHYRVSYLRSYHPPKITMRDAAFKFIGQAYNKASSNGKYYANARQIMYAARPLIIGLIGADAWDDKKSPMYFQNLLKDFIEENEYANLKVVWDARGHLKEPHTKTLIGLGGAEVMKYRQDQSKKVIEETTSVTFDHIIGTTGPKNRFGAVLFIEKEGFDIQLEDAGLSNKWDIAIMSSKGVPNGATCNLGAMVGVPVMALHDFDYAGFKIVKTLREGARLSSGIRNLIDIGLRLGDVEGLESEPDDPPGDAKYYLKSCGATKEECEFLISQRVEINALSTEELIAFLERKFKEIGIKKVVPDLDALSKTYRRALLYQELEKHTEKIIEDQASQTIPEDLIQKIKDNLEENPNQSWDEAVWDLAEENSEVTGNANGDSYPSF